MCIICICMYVCVIYVYHRADFIHAIIRWKGAVVPAAQTGLARGPASSARSASSWAAEPLSKAVQASTHSPAKYKQKYVHKDHIVSVY